jgi:hypothetical protein
MKVLKQDEIHEVTGAGEDVSQGSEGLPWWWNLPGGPGNPQPPLPPQQGPIVR